MMALEVVNGTEMQGTDLGYSLTVIVMILVWMSRLKGEKKRGGLLLGSGLANISMMMTFTEMRNQGDQVRAFSHTNPELTFRHPFKVSEKVDTQSCR